ncbi:MULTISPECIES: hypothetical protein [unclassified Sphingobacterium]|nr:MULTISPECIES: hypothetical protein [unclassified Sphingobacterium]
MKIIPNEEEARQQLIYRIKAIGEYIKKLEGTSSSYPTLKAFPYEY